MPPRGWVLTLNQNLPDDVRVRAARAVTVSYNPRFTSRKKRYRYLLVRDKVPDPLLRNRAWRVGYDMDMDEAGARGSAIVGTHDFAAFRSARDVRDVTVRTITAVKVAQLPFDPRLWTITIEGNSFLYNMVRILVGTLVDVARDNLPEGTIARALAGEGALRSPVRPRPRTGSRSSTSRSSCRTMRVTDGRREADRTRSACAPRTPNEGRTIAGLWRELWDAHEAWGGYAGTRDARVYEQLAQRLSEDARVRGGQPVLGRHIHLVAAAERRRRRSGRGLVRASRRRRGDAVHVRGALAHRLVARAHARRRPRAARGARRGRAPAEPRRAGRARGRGARAESRTRVLRERRLRARVVDGAHRDRRRRRRRRRSSPYAARVATPNDALPIALLDPALAARRRAQGDVRFDRPRAVDATFVGALAAHLARPSATRSERARRRRSERHGAREREPHGDVARSAVLARAPRPARSLRRRSGARSAPARRRARAPRSPARARARRGDARAHGSRSAGPRAPRRRAASWAARPGRASSNASRSVDDARARAQGIALFSCCWRIASTDVGAWARG